LSGCGQCLTETGKFTVERPLSGASQAIVTAAIVISFFQLSYEASGRHSLQ